MMRTDFDAEDWAGRLAGALPRLAQAQEPYLAHHWRYHPRTQRTVNGRDVTPFPLDDVRMVYARARYSKQYGEETQYAALRKALDPVRHALLCHPVLERVAVTGRLIGENNFWMRIVNSGSTVSAGDLIAGLMARAAELPVDRFRSAARELNAFLLPLESEVPRETLGELDEGYHALLFCGLDVTGRVEVEENLALLACDDVQRWVDEELLRELAPRGSGFHGWRTVGAVVHPFRWRPIFRRRGSVNEPTLGPPETFLPDAAALLDLLAVSHMTPVVPLAALAGRVDRSARTLFGLEGQSPGFYQSWPAKGIDGFHGCPVLRPEAFADAKEAFVNRANERYDMLAPVIGRLSEGLATNGRFAVGDGIQHVAIALEQMYVPDEGRIGKKLRNRASRFLGTDAENREKVLETVWEFYDTRSDIIHNRLHRTSAERIRSVFDSGFDVARRSLFKLLREGRPEEWNGSGEPKD